MASRSPRRTKWLTCFVPHRLEMLRSPAWQSMPRPLYKIIERLEIEHLAHGGQENGHLYVPFSQFERYGVSKRRIRRLLELGQDLGLVEVLRDPSATNWDIRPPNAYRLTYVPARSQRLPTDEWRSISKERAATLLERYRVADSSIRDGALEAPARAKIA